MKSAVALLALFAVISLTSAVPPEYVKKISSYIDACTAKHGTDKANVMKLIASKTLPESQELKCTFDCYLTEAGYIKDGKLDWDAIKASNEEKYADDAESLEKSQKIADICKEQVNVDDKKECEFSSALLGCIYPESEKMDLKVPDFLKAKA